MSSDRQPIVVAVCGKGGAGKTAITAVLASCIRRQHPAGRMLLIDADPAGGLTHTLGVSTGRTVGQVREEVLHQARSADATEKNRLAAAVDYYLLESLIERQEWCLLSMGHGRSAGCFCPVNTLIRQAIDTLASDFDRIIIDGEAGIEQIMRQVMRRVDTLLAVSDTSARGLLTACLVRDLAADEKLLSSAELKLVLNRVADDDLALQAAREKGLEPALLLPEDPLVGQWDARSKSLYDLPRDTPFVTAVENIAAWLSSTPR